VWASADLVHEYGRNFVVKKGVGSDWLIVGSSGNKQQGISWSSKEVFTDSQLMATAFNRVISLACFLVVTGKCVIRNIERTLKIKLILYN
jgi:hypothetical protein